MVWGGQIGEPSIAAAKISSKCVCGPRYYVTPHPPRDDLLHGSIPRAVLRLAMPVMGGMLLQCAFNVVDTWWVAHLGAASVAAISTSGFVVWALFALCGMVGIGVNAMVARFVGGRRPQEATRVACQGLVLAVVVSVFVGLIGLSFRYSLFSLMRTAEDVNRGGIRYLTVLFAGAPCIFLHFTVNAIFRGAGDTLTPLKILGIALSINVVTDPLLIFGIGPFPRLEEAGAAVSTILSRFIAVTLGIMYLRRDGVRGRLDFRNVSLKLAPSMWLRILRIGIPSCTSGLLFCAVYVLLTRTTTLFGTEAVAALGLGHRVESFAYVVGIGFAASAATLVGQSLGARQPGRAAACAWNAAGIVSVIMLLFSILFFTIPDRLIALFIDDPLVVSMGAMYLWVIAFSLVLEGIGVVMDGSFSGAGDTVPPMLIAVPLTLARLPVAGFLALSLGWGVVGIWWAISLCTIVKGIVVTLWFLRGKWKQKRV